MPVLEIGSPTFTGRYGNTHLIKAEYLERFPELAGCIGIEKIMHKEKKITPGIEFGSYEVIDLFFMPKTKTKKTRPYVLYKCLNCGAENHARFSDFKRTSSNPKCIKCRLHNFKGGDEIGSSGIRYLEELGQDKGQNLRIKAKCHCGKIFHPRLTDIVNGHTESCGCSKKHSSVGLGPFINQSGKFALDESAFTSLYIMRFKKNGEIIHKVGLAEKVENRRRDIEREVGAEVSVKAQWQLPYNLAFAVEQCTLQALRHTFKCASEDLPNVHGKTECFYCDSTIDVMNILKKTLEKMDLIGPFGLILKSGLLPTPKLIDKVEKLEANFPWRSVN